LIELSMLSNAYKNRAQIVHISLRQLFIDTLVA